ncbi:hypothetical protein ACIP79_14430 [Streptomyces sp. NPDC088747]|uniref:hypothetical protein n=1 Tax=Streptomyces sp. NPDC088747 TaxID=3365886 RepID=UPI0037F5370A
MVRGSRVLILAAAATAVLAAPLTGCSDDTSPSGAASKAASAASKAASAASEAGDALSSATADAGDTLASATAEAGEKFDEFKSGVDAKGDVRTGDVGTDSAGRSTAGITVTNSGSSSRSYAVQVDFRDPGGNLLDTVVVTVDGVGAGATKDATATSNRTLSGDVTAEVSRAVRK